MLCNKNPTLDFPFEKHFLQYVCIYNVRSKRGKHRPRLPVHVADTPTLFELLGRRNRGTGGGTPQCFPNQNDSRV